MQVYLKYNNHIYHKDIFAVSLIFHNVLQTGGYFTISFFFLIWHAIS